MGHVELEVEHMRAKPNRKVTRLKLPLPPPPLSEWGTKSKLKMYLWKGLMKD